MYLRDEDGASPLHYAASIGSLEGVRELLHRSTTLALEWDRNGYLPIHLACKMGHVEVVKEFFRKEWPNVKDMLTPDGQNILHIAVENRRDEVVKYLLSLDQCMINEKDINGNTPLHLASKKHHLDILTSLSEDNRVEKNIKNNDNVTVHDILWLNDNVPMDTRELLSNTILPSAGAYGRETARSIYLQRKELPNKDLINNRANTAILVAILIATVTFAAGFTVPGNVYGSDDRDPQLRGMAVLASKTMFKLFIISDTIAMYSSTTASVILMWTQFENHEFSAQQSVEWGLSMVGLALVTMCLAFMAATSLVVSNISWLFNLIIVIAVLFSYFMLAKFGVFVVPMSTLADETFELPRRFFSNLRQFGGVSMSRGLKKHMDQGVRS